MHEADMAMVTIEDCQEMLKYKDQRVVISAGQVVGFETEKYPRTGGRPCEDR